MALATWLLHTRIVRGVGYGRDFLWDETFHALYALRMAEGIARAQLVGIVYDSYRSVMWPPLYSWYLGTLFVLAGPSTALARASGLPLLVILTFLLFFTGRKLGAVNGAGGILAGTVTALSIVCSNGILTLSTEIMAESLANVWLASCIWLFLWQRSARMSGGAHRTDVAYALLGVAVAAAFFTRYNYGILVAVSLGLSYGVDRLLEPETIDARGLSIAAAVLGGILLIWFAYPPKVTHTLAWLLNTPMGPDRFSLEGLLYFPRQLSWLAGSPGLLLVWLIALACSLRPAVLESDGGVRFVVILLGLQLAFGELAVNKQPRFLLPAAPAFALLTGYWAERLYDRLRQPAAKPSTLLLTTVTAVAMVLLWIDIRQVAEAEGPKPFPSEEQQVLESMDRELSQHGATLVLSAARLTPPPGTIDWHLIVNRRMELAGAGSVGTNLAEQQFLAVWRPRLPAFFVRSLEQQINRYPGTFGTYTAYVGWPLDLPNEFAPAQYRQRVQWLVDRHPVNRILVIVGTGRQTDPVLTSPFITAELGELGYAPAVVERSTFGKFEVRLLGFARRSSP